MPLTAVLFASCTESTITRSQPDVSPSQPTATSITRMAPERCRGHDGQAADIDGDGETEIVYHAWSKGRAQVGVCFTDGRNDALPGLGQAETMIVLYEDVAERDVILFGATGMTEGIYRMAIWKAGRLTVVRDARTSRPLEAHAGLDAETGIAWAWGWNCDRIKAIGTGSEVHGTLVQVRVQRVRGGLKWGGRGYVWRNTDLATSDSFRRGVMGEGDPLDAANHLVKDCQP
jgi:hypothetical protein